MLPEFPRAYDAIQKVWNQLLFNALGFSDPFISQVPLRVQKEGHRAFLGESEFDYKKSSSSYNWTPESAKGIPTEEYFEIPKRVGQEMAAAQAKDAFSVIAKPTPRSGVINKTDGPFTFDLWLSKMDAMEIDFDEAGIPIWPQWFLSEELIAQVQTIMQELNSENQQRWAELVAKKRKEFDEREARRRLVE